MTEPTSISDAKALSKIRPAHIVGVVAAPVAVVALAAVAGAWPTARLAGSSGLAAMVAACAITAVATILGSSPVVWAVVKDPAKVLMAALAATLCRVMILVMIAAPVALASGLPTRTFLIWVAVSYVVALFAETVCLVLLIRRMEAD